MLSAAGEALAEFEAAAELYARCCYREMELEAQKPLEKHEAICRLIEASGQGGEKPLSVTAAEKLVEGELRYAAHLLAMREAVLEKIRAYGVREAAKLRVQIALAMEPEPRPC